MTRPDRRIRTLHLRLVSWQLALHGELLLFLACDSFADGDRIGDTVKNIYIYKYKCTYIYTRIWTVDLHTCTHNMVYEELLIK
jgi:hypothetical protein